MPHPSWNSMHLTLKTEATKPAAPQRPAAAGALRPVCRSLQPRAPASRARDENARRGVPRVLAALSRPARDDYPFHDWTAVVPSCGRICFKKRKVNLNQVFAGQAGGVKQVG